MPLANFKSIFCVSSEDKAHPANNLLLDTNKKWKCQTNGESLAYVILQLEKTTEITGIDIGNEHSAFIEVLVGKNGWPQDKFKQILLTSSFMTPMESRNSTVNNRVRCFAKNALISPVCDDKWDLIKVVCTQPFNKHVKYGLSFVKVHCVDEAPVNPTGQKANYLSSATMFGRFKVREDSPDSDLDDGKPSSTLFSKWREEKLSPTKESGGTNTANLSAAAAIREASNKLSTTNYSPEVAKVDPEQSCSVKKKRGTKDIDEKCPPDRNRHDLMYDEEDDTKSIPQLEMKIIRDRDRIEKEQKGMQAKNSKPSGSRDSSKKMGASTTKFREFADADLTPGRGNISLPKARADTPRSEKRLNGGPLQSKKADLKVETPPSSSKKRPSSPMQQDKPIAKKKMTPVKKVTYKPYSKLLEGVVLVISGIQNPERGVIRDKAMRMGARYKPDWDDTCTHLICAFKNTPKYNQVKGHGKIIKKDWIIQCDSQRKRISWRRHAVDSSDMDQPESEEEIVDMTSKRDDGNISDQSISSSESLPNARASLNKNDSDLEDNAKDDDEVCIYDVETDEEPSHGADHDVSQAMGSIFAGHTFHFSGDIGAVDEIKLRQLVVMNGGSICARANDADYVISKKAYDDGVENLKGCVVNPLWVHESCELNQLLPINRYKL